MDTTERQISHFSEKCDELIRSKFILAPSKISDLLRTVATTPALVALFEKATAQFDYLKAQEKYMLPSPDGTQNKGILLLPESPIDRLAFIFCILVDIDNQNVNFNLFLQTFFAEDGSYTAAFELFITQVIRPFKTAVCDEFLPKPVEQKTLINNTTNKTPEKKLKRNKKAIFASLLPVIKEEIAALNACSLAQTDRAAGDVILNEMYAAAKASDGAGVKALFIGYEYFSAHTGRISEKLSALAEIIGEL